jgi:hypothetical protein
MNFGDITTFDFIYVFLINFIFQLPYLVLLKLDYILQNCCRYNKYVFLFKLLKIEMFGTISIIKPSIL